MLNLENYSSGKHRVRRQMKKKKSATKSIGNIKEAGALHPVTWDSKSKNVLFDDMKIGTASDPKKAKKVAKAHARKEGLNFTPSRG